MRSLPFLQDVNSMLGHQSLLTATSSTHKKLQKRRCSDQKVDSGSGILDGILELLASQFDKTTDLAVHTDDTF